MNKKVLKRFAVAVRVELIESVSSKIEYLLSPSYRENLALYDTHKDSIKKIRERYEKEKDDFIEEVAYIWFNRLIALRFMDVHSITPQNVISSSSEAPLPQIFSDAKLGSIDEKLSLDRQKFYDLIDGKIRGAEDRDNEAYKMLFIAVCNYFSSIMPTMFESIKDYTELLLPDDMLSSNSIRAKVVEAMSEEDCQDIEIIGWLYQFYISEKKDEVFTKLKKNQKITPSNIPAATQLFTPHWIVKYLVENSLGKLWMLNHPDSNLKNQMRYYIEQEEPNNFIKIDSPQELTFLDPCCGSGHMLSYAFDLLSKIYEEEGYPKSEIPTLVLQSNLFGCDIDKRAATLANFTLMMKARLYHRRFFKKKVTPNVIELQEYGDEFKDIKNFGSLLTPNESEEFQDGIFGTNSKKYEIQKNILSNKFDCIVTNPPYMGSKGMNKELSDFVKKRYPDSKSDLFAVFMERGFELTKKYGYMAMITMQSWMFLSSYEKLRKKLLKNYSITTMAHLDNMVMGIAFGTSATVWHKKEPDANTKAVYFKINLDDLDENREIKGLK